MSAVTPPAIASSTAAKASLTAVGVKKSKEEIKDGEKEKDGTSDATSSGAQSAVTQNKSTLTQAGEALAKGTAPSGLSNTQPNNFTPNQVAGLTGFGAGGLGAAGGFGGLAALSGLGGLFGGLSGAFRGGCASKGGGCGAPTQNNPDGHNQQQNSALANASPQDLMKISDNLKVNASDPKIANNSPLQQSLLSLSGKVQELATAKESKQAPNPNLLQQIKTISDRTQDQLSHSGLRDEKNQPLDLQDVMTDPKAVEEAKPVPAPPEPLQVEHPGDEEGS